MPVNAKRTTNDVAAMKPHLPRGLCRNRRMRRAKRATSSTRKAKTITSGLSATDRPTTTRASRTVRTFDMPGCALYQSTCLLRNRGTPLLPYSPHLLKDASFCPVREVGGFGEAPRRQTHHL